jgi:hypothetical protein
VNGLQSGRCAQKSTLYSDAKAQTFLDSLTSKLRTKLDALQLTNGYNRGRYELTHAPMDSDIASSNSKYYQILKKRSADLDFLMPQFYNGVTRPGIDGVGGTGSGSMRAVDLFGNLANDMFVGQPNKIVFGFCISDCSGTGSNVNGNTAVQVLSDLKTYNGGEFGCNGGAFFWVAEHDVGGSWSKTVGNVISQTAGCSNLSSTTSTTSTGTTTTTTRSSTSSATTTTKPPLTTTTLLTTTSTSTSTTTSNTQCARPLGSKVRVNSLYGQPIQMFELQVLSFGVNVARGKTTSQSSTLKNSFVSSRAVDGNSLTFSHTDDSSPWWEVNLGGNHPVESIVITNRWCRDTDDSLGCLCRLSHSVVSIVDQNGGWVASEIIGDTCGKLEVNIAFPCQE